MTAAFLIPAAAVSGLRLPQGQLKKPGANPMERKVFLAGPSRRSSFTLARRDVWRRPSSIVELDRS